MAEITKSLTRTGAGAAGGLGGTVLTREWFDSPRDDSVTRPSVLWGVGTGAAMLSVAALARRGSIDIPDHLMPAIQTWGTVGTTAGLFSAAFPKGADESILPVSREQTMRRIPSR
jgi:hypothetical protein